MYIVLCSNRQESNTSTLIIIKLTLRTAIVIQYSSIYDSIWFIFIIYVRFLCHLKFRKRQKCFYERAASCASNADAARNLKHDGRRFAHWRVVSFHIQKVYAWSLRLILNYGLYAHGNDENYRWPLAQIILTELSSTGLSARQYCVQLRIKLDSRQFCHSLFLSKESWC